MDEFKALYVKEIVNGDGIMSPKLIALFDTTLANDFGGDHNKMDDLIVELTHQPSEVDLLKAKANQNEQNILDMMEYVSAMGGEQSV